MQGQEIEISQPDLSNRRCRKTPKRWKMQKKLLGDTLNSQSDSMSQSAGVPIKILKLESSFGKSFGQRG